MDIDNIIPFLIFIVWVFASIFGKKAIGKRNGSESGGGGGGLLEKIQKTVDTITNEVKSASTPPEFNLDFLENDGLLEDEIVVSKHKNPPTPPSERIQKATPFPAVISESTQKVSASKAKYSKEKLKDAIVWSEIMAPPLALRD